MQNHRTMPLDQAGEGQFGIVPVVRGESLKELPIRQPPDPALNTRTRPEIHSFQITGYGLSLRLTVYTISR